MAVCLIFLLVGMGTGWAATYYIDYVSGSDSNSGITKSTPWKNQPYMQGFAGSYTHTVRDQFIFKGGIAWPSTCFPLTPTAGGASTSSPDYYGVDSAWYAGSSWARPIFSDGGTANKSFFYFSSPNGNNITVDNIEFTGLYWIGTGEVNYVNLYAATGITFSNCYFHGWSHATAGSGCNDNLDIFVSGLWSPFTWAQTQTVSNCICDGSDSTGGGDAGMFWHGGGNMIGCTIRNIPNGFLPTAVIAKAIGNNIGPTLSSFTGRHENAIEDNGVSGTFYVIGNYIHDLVIGTEPCFLGTTYATTFYIYNNVIWNFQYPGPGIEGTTCLAVYWLNNTIDASSGNQPCINLGTGIITNLINRNNHFIVNTNGGMRNNTALITNLTESNNLVETLSQANTAGYHASSKYAPTSASQPTVDAGASQSWLFNTDILGVTRPQGAGWDIGAYEYSGGSALPSPTNLRLK